MKIGLIIPARYQSSRFPGKPLAKILGMPMIWHVWNQCIKAIEREKVFVATDSEEILNAVNRFGGNGIMTSEECMTGTDRVAEANKALNFDYVVNVQGDEPIIDPDNINKVVNQAKRNPSSVINLAAAITNQEDFYNLSIPKVVFNENNKLLYMSRAPIPNNKENKLVHAYRQVCVYGFHKEHLESFSKANSKTNLESIEDIEILRFLDLSINVEMMIVQSDNIAVDHPEDIEKVERLLTAQI